MHIDCRSATTSFTQGLPAQVAPTVRGGGAASLLPLSPCPWKDRSTLRLPTAGISLTARFSFCKVSSNSENRSPCLCAKPRGPRKGFSWRKPDRGKLLPAQFQRSAHVAGLLRSTALPLSFPSPFQACSQGLFRQVLTLNSVWPSIY